MAAKVPSRPILRHLRLLVEDRSLARSRPQTRGVCMVCPSRSQASNLSVSVSFSKQPRTATQRRHLSSTSSVFASPSSSSEEVVNHPDPTNHYTLFPKTIPSGPPPGSAFEISVPDLRREFLQLQARYHPDKFPSEHKIRAEALSSTINNAYKTLSDPLLRAQYILLDFHGVDVLAEDQGSAQQDPETLMEVMEAQEAIEEAVEESEIEALKEINKKRIDDTVKALGEAIDNGDIEGARKDCVKLRFWRSLQEGLHSWEPGKEVRLTH